MGTMKQTGNRNTMKKKIIISYTDILSNMLSFWQMRVLTIERTIKNEKIFSTKPLTEFDWLIKTFRQTHESADLKNLLSYYCNHLDTQHSIAIYCFFLTLQEKNISNKNHIRSYYILLLS